MTGKSRHRHRVVKPLHRRLKLAPERLGQNLLHDAPPFLIDPAAVAPAARGDLHLQHDDVWIIARFPQHHLRAIDLRHRHRSFDKKHPMALRKAREKLLRPLPDPIPPEVRVHDDRERFAAARLRVGQKFARIWEVGAIALGCPYSCVKSKARPPRCLCGEDELSSRCLTDRLGAG